MTILIRGYPRNEYNAVISNQRCKPCHHLGTLILDKVSYIDRVAFRLKRWAGAPAEHRSHIQKEARHMRETYMKDVKEIFTGKIITGSSIDIMN